jgi:general L-amino acid transport system substrate-binding protein
MLFSKNVIRILGLIGVSGFICFSSSLQANAQGTLQKVKSQKYLNCGIGGDLAGFSALNSKGEAQGIDADFCRAMAAAIGVEARFKALNATTRFPALQSGEIDVLTRNTTWNFTRDVKLAFDFAGVNYYDGQGFLVTKNLKIKSAKELNGASICVQSGTTTELNLAEFFKNNKMKYKAVVFADFNDANKAYAAGRCDAYTTDASGLAAVRASLAKPNDHLILPDIISKEPLGPVTRQGDASWTDFVRWTLNALITAEEKNLTKENIAKQEGNKDPEVRRLLGFEGDLGHELGLEKNWALKAISAAGNYGEIFERNLGSSTPLKLQRGLNALWSQGGLIYSPPFN